MCSFPWNWLRTKPYGYFTFYPSDAKTTILSSASAPEENLFEFQIGKNGKKHWLWDFIFNSYVKDKSTLRLFQKDCHDWENGP